MTSSHARLNALKSASLLILFCAAAGTAVSAQTRADAKRDLETVLRPGMTVWITDSTGREERTEIVSVSGGIVSATVGGDIRRLPATDVVRVRARHSDSVLNGALIGAGAAVASGLLLCTAMEPWENCRDDVGPIFGIGALGAGVGIGIDALIRGRRTIYEARQGRAQMRVAPVVARHATGLRVSFSF